MPVAESCRCYTINETSAPAGYGDASQADVVVTVANGTNCTTSPPAEAATATFTNPPLGEIEVQFRDLTSGETASSIVCTGLTPVSENGDPDPAFDDTDEVYMNLPPGSYTCTVVIDP
jgi:hypothetical protein